MSLETTGQPENIGLRSKETAKAFDYIQSWIDEDRAPGAAIGLARHGWFLSRSFGRMAPEVDAPPIPPDAIFLTASVSKPVTCAAMVLLLERGQVPLNMPVVSMVPEFGQQGKEGVTVHHLLTHTSGLPDMIPENIEYRKQLRPLDAFITRICELDLLFEPGTNISYQSTGIAMLGEILKRVTGTPLPEFLRQEIFLPLGMRDTSLGSRYIDLERVPVIRLTDDLVDADWNWNNAYWRGFGAPWGGMFSTVRDINVFCQTFLHGGTAGDVRIFDPATVEAATANQTQAMLQIPDEVKQEEAWGLGWQINRSLTTFGADNPPSSRTFGHYGATGTMDWADPETGLSCVLFTTQPSLCNSDEFHRCTDLVMTALGR